MLQIDLRRRLDFRCRAGERSDYLAKSPIGVNSVFRDNFNG